MSGLARLAIHTQTIRAWDLRTCCERFAAAGVAGIGVWRHLIDPDAGGVTPAEGARMIADSGLRVPSLVRAGFFVSGEGRARADAIDDARRAIDDARTIGADHVVIVPGADPGVALSVARGVVGEALSALGAYAQSAGVGLALEPLHPQYAADRSCVNTLEDALDLCDEVDNPWVGVALDVYHVWWEAALDAQIERACPGQLFGFHVCDWKPDQRDPLNDRGLMGDGCIDLAYLADIVEAAGFTGVREVEVFSEHYWRMDPDEYLALIIERYRAHCPE